jgi:hypothetical protein
LPIRHRANAEDIAQHDSAARALGRLARTFPAQIEALNHYERWQARHHRAERVGR